jgi:hypothetical protein
MGLDIYKETHNFQIYCRSQLIEYCIKKKIFKFMKVTLYFLVYLFEG